MVCNWYDILVQVGQGVDLTKSGGWGRNGCRKDRRRRWEDAPNKEKYSVQQTDVGRPSKRTRIQK